MANAYTWEKYSHYYTETDEDGLSAADYLTADELSALVDLLLEQIVEEWFEDDQNV